MTGLLAASGDNTFQFLHDFFHSGTWYLLVLNECKNLLPNNLCGIYETRPKICREYDPTDCEYTSEVEFDLYYDVTANVKPTGLRTHGGPTLTDMKDEKGTDIKLPA